MSREDWAPGAIITVFINCIVDGSWQRRRLGAMLMQQRYIPFAVVSGGAGSGGCKECLPGDSPCMLSTGLFGCCSRSLPRLPAG